MATACAELSATLARVHTTTTTTSTTANKGTHVTTVLIVAATTTTTTIIIVVIIVIVGKGDARAHAVVALASQKRLHLRFPCSIGTRQLRREVKVHQAVSLAHADKLQGRRKGQREFKRSREREM